MGSFGSCVKISKSTAVHRATTITPSPSRPGQPHITASANMGRDKKIANAMKRSDEHRKARRAKEQVKLKRRMEVSLVIELSPGSSILTSAPASQGREGRGRRGAQEGASGQEHSSNDRQHACLRPVLVPHCRPRRSPCSRGARRRGFQASQCPSRGGRGNGRG